MFKNLILSLLFVITLSGQSLENYNDIKTFSKMWGMALSSGQYSTARINETYQIEIGYISHQFDFSDIKNPYLFQGDTIGKVTLNSVYTQIDLPISTQLGFRFGLPIKESEFNYSTNMYGFSAKIQISDFIWKKLPAISIQAQKIFMKIDDKIELNTFSPSVHMSYDISFVTLNVGATQFSTNFVSGEKDIEFKDIIYKAGIMLDLSYFKLYGEKAFYTFDSNFTFGASILF